MENSSIINCHLCGYDSELKAENHLGYQKPQTFSIYHCKNCNTAFSSPVVDTSDLYERIYNNVSNVPGYDRYWTYFSTIKNMPEPFSYLSESEDTYWAVNKALGSIVKDKKNTKILEVGSGLGYLTYALIQDKYQVNGIDISKTAVERANKTFGKNFICSDLHVYADLNPNIFDVVILTEVIEHVASPISFFESIVKLLKPGGHIILTTPNKSFFPNETLWATELPPIHLWWFSEESMQYFAKKFNLDVSFINLADFHKKTYKSIDLRQGKVMPFFTENGELILYPNKKKKFVEVLKKLFKKFPYALEGYRRSKGLLNSNFKVCKDSGTILCAIFEVKSSNM